MTVDLERKELMKANLELLKSKGAFISTECRRHTDAELMSHFCVFARTTVNSSEFGKPMSDAMWFSIKTAPHVDEVLRRQSEIETLND